MTIFFKSTNLKGAVRAVFRFTWRFARIELRPAGGSPHTVDVAFAATHGAPRLGHFKYPPLRHRQFSFCDGSKVVLIVKARTVPSLSTYNECF
jgi:hypothetical protein